jgi:hypothetical protein
MFRNHLKIAYRNFIRHKLYSFINVFGLAIGLSICMIISIWVLRELNYDRFHENANRIYRVERELYRDNLYQRWPITGGLYKQVLIEDFPRSKMPCASGEENLPLRTTKTIFTGKRCSL